MLGSALQLSERAGRTQAVRHLKERLAQERSPALRAALAGSLRRHTIAEDNLARWWWEQFDSTLQWLDTAARIGALGGLNSQQTTKLARLLTTLTSESAWLSDLLAEGGYDGSANEILAICKDEINAGAGDALVAMDRTTSVGRLIEGAAVALLRVAPRGTEGTRVSSHSRTRLRRRQNGTLLTEVAVATDQLRSRPGASSPTQEWQTRLGRVAEVWGDGWVLRQAVAGMPPGIDLLPIAASVEPARQDLATVLELEAAARSNKGNSDWWRRRLSTCGSPLEQRHWISSLLTIAHPQVVVDISDGLNEHVEQLAPKHVAAVRDGLKASMRSAAVRKLALQDPLRLMQVQFTHRALWLLRVVATDGTVEQIDKRIVDGFEALLQPGMGDMRELLRIVGASKTIKVDSLRGSRPVLPLGGWASDVKLGLIRSRLATDILRAPDEWPGDLVQCAVEQVAKRISDAAKPMAAVAEVDRWFQEQ